MPKIIITIRGGVVGVATAIPEGIELEFRDYDIPKVEDVEAGEFACRVDEDGDTYAVELWGKSTELFEVEPATLDLLNGGEKVQINPGWTIISADGISTPEDRA